MEEFFITAKRLNSLYKDYKSNFVSNNSFKKKRKKNIYIENEPKWKKIYLQS